MNDDVLTVYNEKDQELTISLLESFKAKDNTTLRAGLLYNYWNTPNGKRFYYGNKARVSTYSAVFAGEHQINNTTIDAGIRLTQEYFVDWGGFSIEGSGGKFKNVESIHNQWQPVTWQATSGIISKVSEKLTGSATLSGGTIAPRKGALTDDGSGVLDEKRLNGDVGLNYQTGSGTNMKIAVFTTRRFDAITYSGNTLEKSDGSIMELYQNVEKRNLGIELEMSTVVFPKIASLNGNLTYLEPEYKSSGKWEADEEMPNLVWNIGLNSQFGKFHTSMMYHYTGKYENDRFVEKSWLNANGKAPLGGYGEFQVKADYALGCKSLKKCKLFVELFNIFNNKYQTVAGYPDIGRKIMFGMSASFL